ncbi:MAG: HIT family protein [Gammaproteobacteria bacterium]
MPDCPFCNIKPERILREAALTVSIWDAFPVSPGHALIVPRRHVVSWAEATGEEKLDLLAAIDAVRDLIDQLHHPDGCNVGFNDGPAAGHTVMHLHVHVIPRYQGDVPDPRGGVRWVLPHNARYWDTDWK